MNTHSSTATIFYANKDAFNVASSYLPPGSVVKVISDARWEVYRDQTESHEVLYAQETTCQVGWIYEEGEQYGLEPVKDLGVIQSIAISTPLGTANLVDNDMALIGAATEARNSGVDAFVLAIESNTGLCQALKNRIPYLVFE